MTRPVTMTVDYEAAAAYISLTDEPVARTIELTDEILVDLDGMDVVVGVEVLDLSEPIPFERLADVCHVHSDTIDALRRIRPNVEGFVSLMSAAEGTAAGAPPALIPA